MLLGHQITFSKYIYIYIYQMFEKVIMLVQHTFCHNCSKWQIVNNEVKYVYSYNRDRQLLAAYCIKHIREL